MDTMATLCFTLSIHLLLLSISAQAVGWSDYRERKAEGTLRLSKNCTSLKVRLDQHDTVKLRSTIRLISNSVIPANLTCTAHYMTGNKDQGICIKNEGLFFESPDPGVQLKIFTSRFGPDKAFNYFHQGSDFDEWCTREPLVSIELTNGREFHDLGDQYIVRFLVTNVSRDSIPKDYRMDSFKECNLSHVLKSGEEIRISGQEYPAVSDLPVNCRLTFSTKSEEEYDEVCVRIVEHKPHTNCLSTLTVSGFNLRFWPESEVLGCNDTHSQLRQGQEMCSSSKTLTFHLARTSATDTGHTFTAVVKVKWHTHWDVIAQENSELSGLGFVKGVTYFVAAIDSLAGIMAAVLASMFRRPRSFWKSWAESVKIPEKCDAVHYEDTCTAVSGSKIEEIMEVKAY